MGLPSSQFRDNWYDLAPPWLTTGIAEKYLYTLQLCSDILLDKMDQAVRIRYPGQGDVSQLPYLAADRVLSQGPQESNAAFIGRLKQAFATWKEAGSRGAIMGQLQAYLQNLQPTVAATLPEMTIVGGNATWTTWSTNYIGDPVGTEPTLTRVAANWNWDGKYQPWRAWLILYMSLVPTGQSGAAAATGAVTGPTNGTGVNTNGIWVPNAASTGGVGFVTLTGLSGIVSTNLGQWITLSGSANAANNGTFPITSIVSATSVQIANPAAVGSDAGPIAWTIGTYPFIGPAPVWGAPGLVYGQGELVVPPIDTGHLVGGIWEPSGVSTTNPTISWGLNCSSNVIQSIREILRTWKSAGTYYPDIIVAFDGSTGAAGSAFSPNSTEGAGNPDGTFGGRGKNVGGVWVPNRLVTSEYDGWCQGSGSWPGGASEVT